MSSRNQMLATLRRSSPPLSPLPEPPAGIVCSDPESQFAGTFTSVGGKFLRVQSSAEANAELAKSEAYANAEGIVSLVDGVGRSTVEVASLGRPHELEGLDVAILPGDFGVAENGAVWIPGRALGPQRAIFVIAQHLVLVVPAGQLVDTMHQAYDRLRIERPGFGVFISGPSKTADIEQSLVMGAQGPRSCTLFLLG